MTLTASQLADLVDKSKAYMGLEDDDERFKADGLAIYHDESASATAATVQIEDGEMVLTITGGTNDGTDTLDLSGTAYDTLGELVDAINALAKGFHATLLTDEDYDAGLLYRLASTSIYGQENEQTLQFENQGLLELLITNMLASLERYLDRDVLSTDYTERLQPVGGVVTLTHPEVSKVSRVGIEYTDGLRVRYTGTDTNARVEVTETAVVTVSRVGASETSTESTFADNASTGDMATTINALSGWTATVANSYPSAYLAQMPAQDAKNNLVDLEVWEDCDEDYRVDYKGGFIEFFREHFPEGWVFVAYTAGFATMPAALEDKLLAAVKSSWDGVTHDATLESEKLGDYSYKLAMGQVAGVMDWSRFGATLDMYRRVTL
jgi:hypothetical protein